MRTNQNHQSDFILQDFPLFKNLDASALKALTYRLNTTRVDKNLVFLNPSKPTSRFHIIRSGRVKVYTYDIQTDRELTLFILKAGDCFDIFTLFGQSRYQLYYKTLEDSDIMCCPISYFHDWLALNKDFNRDFTSYILKKMARLQESVIDMVLADTATRLLKLLWRHSNRKSKVIEQINDLSDKELASLIGTTRAVMNRHLQIFKEEGLLKTGRNRIEIMDWELLEEKVQKLKPSRAYIA